MPNIHLNNVSKQYEKNAAPAVNAVDLEINDGEFMCLLGPSGCGKTTTLRMIAGLENISDGQLILGDKLVDSKQDGVFVPPEKRNLGSGLSKAMRCGHTSRSRRTSTSA